LLCDIYVIGFHFFHSFDLKTSTNPNHQHQFSFSASATTRNDSEVYAQLLLPKRRGFPLWLPQPHNNLPTEYRKNGVNIGDVGIITSDGVFDFLFNICLPSGHAVNGNRVPDHFRPLEYPEPIDIIEATTASTHFASGSIEMSSIGGSTQYYYLHACSSMFR
jgi:hypothetical protein